MICRKLFFFLFLCSLLITAFTCVSCSRKNDQEKQTGRLYLTADPVSLDPRVGGDRKTQIVLRELFEGLTRVGTTGEIELALASSYTLSSDGLVYTFSLHPAFWSNGKPVTAHDFEYAWKSILNPTFITPFSYAFYSIKNAKQARLGQVPLEQVGIRALDAQTLEVTLEHPAPYFLELTSNPVYSPVYKPLVEQDKNWSTKAGKEYVCNGPFTLEERTPKSHILLKKNPLYVHTVRPKLNFLSFSIIEDPLTAYSLFSEGKLDWFGEPCGTVPLDVIRALDGKNMLNKKIATKVFWLAVGTHNKHLSSPLIRKAIATACNRQTLCSHLLQGNEKPLFSILPSRLTLLTQPLFEDGNEEEAKRLFRKGLQEIHMTEEQYPEIVLTHWSDSIDTAIAQTLQEQIQKTLRVTVRLESCDWSTFFKKMTSGADMQMCCVNWYSYYFDPIYNLEAFKYANNGINNTHWQDARYIELLDMSDNTSDKTKRMNLLEQAEKLIATELPLIPLLNVSYKYVKGVDLEGEALSPSGIMELKGLYKK